MRGAGRNDAGHNPAFLNPKPAFILRSTTRVLCPTLAFVSQLEIAELQRQEVDIRQEKEDKEREVADALAPRLASLELAGTNSKPLFIL